MSLSVCSKNLLDRLPPHDAQAERVLLGSIMGPFPGNLYEQALQTLGRDASGFYMLNHQEIWLAMRRLHEKGLPIDATTVAPTLHDEGKLEKVGGYAYISALVDAGLPGVTVSAYHLPRLLELQRRRALYTMIAEVGDALENPYVSVETIRHRLHHAVNSEPRQDGLPAFDDAGKLVLDDSVRVPPEIIEGLLHRGLKASLSSASKALEGISRGTFSQRLREYKAEGKVLKSAADEKYSLITPKPGHSN